MPLRRRRFALLNGGGVARPISFGSHAYWRVVGSQQAFSANFTAFSAMGFKDRSGNVVAASGGTPLDNGHTSTFVSSNLFDGSNPSFWESIATLVPYCGYQFAAPQEIMQIGLQKATAMDGSFPMSVGSFQYSDDGVLWRFAKRDTISASIPTVDTMVWFDLNDGLQLWNPITSFGAHTYWRIAGGPTGSTSFKNGFIGLSEINFKDKSGTLVAPTGGTPFESGHDTTFVPANAFDGNAATNWGSSSLTNGPISYIGYQFASAKEIMQIGLQRAAVQDSPPPEEVMISYSDDNVTWHLATIIAINDRLLSNAVDTMTWFFLGDPVS